MPEFTPVEIPTAGQRIGQQDRAVASCVSMNQEISSRAADEPVPGARGIAVREAHALQRGRMSLPMADHFS